jgi:hypothetical protein
MLDSKADMKSAPTPTDATIGRFRSRRNPYLRSQPCDLQLYRTKSEPTRLFEDLEKSA